MSKKARIQASSFCFYRRKIQFAEAMSEGVIAETGYFLLQQWRPEIVINPMSLGVQAGRRIGRGGFVASISRSVPDRRGLLRRS
jgi:hypothetical protein